jgi:cysteine desulfuration protein SufE
MTIKEIQDEIVDEFSLFDDWMERYEYIIELGKKLPLIKEEYKTENNIIKGCQ